MTLTDLAHQKVHQDKIEPTSSLLNQYVRSSVQITPAHQTSKPQPFAVGVFSCPFAPIPACCWEAVEACELRRSAEVAVPGFIHSLPAAPSSNLAPWD